MNCINVFCPNPDNNNMKIEELKRIGKAQLMLIETFKKKKKTKAFKTRRFRNKKSKKLKGKIFEPTVMDSFNKWAKKEKEKLVKTGDVAY